MAAAVGQAMAVTPRIGYLIPEFPGQTHVFFWREVRALRDAGEELLILSTRKPSALTCRHEFAATAVAETHYLFPSAIGSAAAWMLSGAARLESGRGYLRELAPEGWKSRLRHSVLLASAVDLLRWSRRNCIDHIHAHSCADSAHVLAIARRMGGPSYSLTLHGDLGVYGTGHRSKMSGAAFICAVGNHLRSQILEQTDVPEHRIITTCMGVDVAELAKLGSNRAYVPGILHIVTVARLNPTKGHIHALAAVRRGLDAGLKLHYTIAGEGPFKEGLLAVIDKLGLGANVTMPGTLSETEVFALLARADAFVLPSVGVGEAWPVSVMEAMGAGLPVIATIIGATPEMINPGVDGLLVPQRDEEALLSNISRLTHDVGLRRSLGNAARRTAERRFSVRVTARTLSDAIHTNVNTVRQQQLASPRRGAA